MKKLAQIPSFLLSPAETANFRLQNQAYMLIIPKKLLENFNISSSELIFELIFDKNRISLLGPESAPRETKTMDVFQNK